MRARFERKGPLAILASAYGQEYELVTPSAPTQEGGIAVVMIMGPLTHHGEWWMGDTYDAIESRVAAALATSADTVVLKIDSPGGEVNGVFECSKTLNLLAAQAGKRLIAYVDETAASAAYALACACEAIYLPTTGQVGSVGVVEALVDATGNDGINGLKWTLVASGARKVDGNPHVPLSPETTAVVQHVVDSLAQVFFGMVAEARKVEPAAVQLLQAGMFRGPDAVAAKLADGVMSWVDLLALLSTPAPAETIAPLKATTAPEGAQQENTTMTRAEMLAALKAALAEDPAPAPAKEPDGDECKDMTAAEFRAALKAALAEGEPAPAPAPEKKDDAPAPAAPAKEPDGDEPKAKALADEHAKAMAAIESEARMALLESRPDLDAKMLANEPLAVVRKVVALTPKPQLVKPTMPNPAAAAQVAATPGAGQVDTAKRGPSANADLNARMGLSPQSRVPSRDGLTLVLPTMTPAEAEAFLAAKGGK